MQNRDKKGRFVKGIIPWDKGIPRSKITCKKISDTKQQRQIPPWNKGKPQPKTTGDKNPAKRLDVRLKIAEKATGRPVLEETRIKIAEKLLGTIPWNTGLPREEQPHYRKPHSIESKAKLSKSHRGEKCYNWQGGISFEPYCHKFNRDLKERIRERDNRTCQYPGCGKRENGTKHTCHHVHYDKLNCNPDLITLCRSCNMKVNFNREYWEAYFMELLKQRGLCI
jgi:hypothetical protein